MIFAHKHDHEAVAVQTKGPGLFGGPTPPSTLILWRCKCGNVLTQELAGRWTLQQVRGERDLTTAERIETDLAVATQQAEDAA